MFFSICVSVVFVFRVCMGLYLYISVDPLFSRDSQNPGPIHIVHTHIYFFGEHRAVSTLENKPTRISDSQSHFCMPTRSHGGQHRHHNTQP